MLLILCMMPLALFGCNGEAEPTEKPTEAPTDAPTDKPIDEADEIVGTKFTLLENEDKFKINGRYIKLKTGVACDNVGAGIEFQGTMKGKVYVEIRTDADAYFTVYVDGVEQEERYRVHGGRFSETLEVADLGETDGEHHIRVVKQTEARYALADFRSVTVDGALGDAPADKEIYIEFIGSSLTCGMGNIGWPDMGVAPSQSAGYEVGTKGMAFLFAEAMGADCSILGVSGMGLAKTWFPPMTMTNFYEATSYYRDEEEKFDFESARVPDIIVLNVGKNDWQLSGSLTPSTEGEFTTAARQNLALIREKYGDEVPIIWAYDLYDKHRMDLIEPILEELGGEEAGYYTCDVTSNQLGGDKHTDLDGHKQAAEDLMNFMKEHDYLGLNVETAQ